MSDFWVLEPDGGDILGDKWAYAVRLEPSEYSSFNRCPVCGGPISLRKWIPPIRIELSKREPNLWGDFVWGTAYLLVSERFKTLYETEKLTGITKFYPQAEIARVGRTHVSQLRGVQLPRYYGIEVEWNGANMDDEASGFIRKAPNESMCSFCRIAPLSRLEQIVIQESTWTGADIFTPRGGPVNYLVSMRFRDLVLKHGLTNAWLIPAEKWAFDDQRPPLLRRWYVRD
jgi:hypothetical protein